MRATPRALGWLSTIPVMLSLMLVTACSANDNNPDTKDPSWFCSKFPCGPEEQIRNLLHAQGWNETIMPTTWNDDRVTAWTSTATYACDAVWLLKSAEKDSDASYQLTAIRRASDQMPYEGGPIAAKDLPAEFSAEKLTKKQFEELVAKHRKSHAVLSRLCEARKR